MTAAQLAHAVASGAMTLAEAFRVVAPAERQLLKVLTFGFRHGARTLTK